MSKKYYYAIVFWNEKTDEEVNTYLQAESYFDAEKLSEHTPKGKPWIEGTLFYLGEDKPDEYNTPLFDFVNR